MALKDYEGIAQKITRTLFLSQSVVSAALITTGTVNAIAGAELSEVIAWAGVPATVLLVAAALGALTWGFVMERIGRRGGLALGMVAQSGHRASPGARKARKDSAACARVKGRRRAIRRMGDSTTWGAWLFVTAAQFCFSRQ